MLLKKRFAATEQLDNVRETKNIKDTVEKESFYTSKKKAAETFLPSLTLSSGQVVKL